MLSTVNKDGFKPNLETQLIPLLATKEESSGESKEKEKPSSSKAANHPLLMQVDIYFGLICVVPLVVCIKVRSPHRHSFDLLLCTSDDKI